MNTSAKILWTTDNKETALNMICLYAHNAKLKGWLEDVQILVWGASQTLISEDKEVQEKVKAMIADGVEIIACQKCAENLGVKDELQACDMKIYYTGELLSSWVKSGESIISV
jgi:hypothetical protein